MSSDFNRIRTFLAYKGFQLEPLPSDGETAFSALRAGEVSFAGAILSVGREHSTDGRPITIAMDAEEKARLQASLANQIEACLGRLEKASGGSGLPVVIVMVNHDPRRQFEDLADMIRGSAETRLPPIDLLIWFDDFRSDQMLFRRSDPDRYKKLRDWFQEA